MVAEALPARSRLLRMLNPMTATFGGAVGAFVAPLSAPIALTARGPNQSLSKAGSSVAPLLAAAVGWVIGRRRLLPLQMLVAPKVVTTGEPA